MPLSKIALVDAITARRFKTPELDLDIMPGPSQQQDDAYTYESQNDQRLDDLHSKIRSLRGVRPSSYPARYLRSSWSR
jgi:hypothetical protein